MPLSVSFSSFSWIINKVLSMASMIRDEDFRIESGRADGGRMFLRVIHLPTQASRVVVGLNDRPYAEVVRELLSAVLQEIEAVGWRKPKEGQEVDDAPGTSL
jgi:hypothetical protein